MGADNIPEALFVSKESVFDHFEDVVFDLMEATDV